jgi:hypothetical protein
MEGSRTQVVVLLGVHGMAISATVGPSAWLLLSEGLRCCRAACKKRPPEPQPEQPEQKHCDYRGAKCDRSGQLYEHNIGIGGHSQGQGHKG